MRKVYYFILTLILGIGISNAAVRDEKSPVRGPQSKQTVARTANNNSSTVTRPLIPRTVARTTIARTATPPSKTTSRTATNDRSTTTTIARTATKKTPAPRAGGITGTSRSGAVNASAGRAARSATNSRATITMSAHDSITFGTGYNTCRDAYFTCMDQFCSTASDTYRRCICSSKLTEIQSRERALSQASDQLQDFTNLNLAIIDKTAGEVNAMMSASAGEYTQSITRDKSASASHLSGISEILYDTKKKSLSTQGTLDIAGDINAIWATTDLAGGVNIANLTGEALYNAVHAQCSELVADKCPSSETQTMVVSAYGMYIENDCSLLIDNLDKQLTNANSNIRNTEHAMNIARLETYNAHNSSTIHDCIAQVRQDITAETACGTDYIHCLDITGLYLNIETGEPIYSPNFYQLTSQISLSGDVLTNQSNRLLVAELNRKRIFAERGLDTCRDIADTVWDEFLRQAITEIYQGQQERIRQVKTECLNVVNNCYDSQRQSLKDFSNTDEQLLLGTQLELSEEMCREKLDACSNLYGGGPNGFAELLNAMKNITTQQIANNCATALQDFANTLCIPPDNDSTHGYPYACRMYAPGEQKYAQITQCNDITKNETTSNTIGISGGGEPVPDSTFTPTRPAYMCPVGSRIYTSCKAEFFLAYNNQPDPIPKPGNQCLKCYTGYRCDGGTATPVLENDINKFEYGVCGPDYVGSMYHKLVRHARQACARPSENTNELPATVMQDINMVMDKFRVSMAQSLSVECERWGGIWVNTVWIDEIKNCDTITGKDATDTANLQQACEKENSTILGQNRTNPDLKHDDTGHTQNKAFYDETGANTKWGFCATDPNATTTTSASATTGTSSGTGSSSNGSNSGPSLSCTAGTTVTLTLINTTNAECCPNGAITPTTQTVSAICGEQPTWPSDVARATCSTNPSCKLGLYSTLQHTSSTPAGNFFNISDGKSPTDATMNNQTIYSFWFDGTTE